MKKVLLQFLLFCSVSYSVMTINGQATWNDVSALAQTKGIVVVPFYTKGAPHYEFTNYYGGDNSQAQQSCAIAFADFLNKLPQAEQQGYAAAIKKTPTVIATSEQLFHALRILQSGLQNKYWHANAILSYPQGNNTVQIAGLNSQQVNSAGDAAREHFNLLRTVIAPQETDATKQKAMLTALWLKFQKDPLKKKLLDTQTALLIEDTKQQTKYDDSYWGNGQNDVGTNHLGQMLMHLRDALQKNTPFETYLTSYKPKTLEEYKAFYTAVTNVQRNPQIPNPSSVTNAPALAVDQQQSWLSKKWNGAKTLLASGWNKLTTPIARFFGRTKTPDVKKELADLTKKLTNLASKLVN